MASNMEIEIAGAVARLRARKKRREDRLVGVHAGGDVADRDADARGRLGPAGDGGEPRLGLHQHVVGLARGVGAVLAVAGDRADHEPRMRAPQLFKRKAELGDGAGLEVLHEHVGLGEHGVEQRLVIGAREIEHHRLLAAVEPDEIRAFATTTCIFARHGELVVVAREVALGPLDLDHARAGVGEPAGAHGRRHRLLQRHHQQT
jgi:hypothetical protein